MSKLLDTLDEDQRAAATHPLSGVLLVKARAGSGKTRTIRARVQHILEAREKQGFKSRILVLAFNTRVRDEISEHMDRELRSDRRDRVKVSTFHQLALSLIHRNRDALAATLAEKPSLTVLGPDRLSMYRREIAESQHASFGVLGPELAGFLLSMNDICANKELTPEELFTKSMQFSRLFDRMRADTAIERPEDVSFLLNWLKAKRFEKGQVMFSDMLPLANSLQSDRLRRLGYIDVIADELQDLNAGQRRLVRGLMEPAKSFMGCGDSSQTIMGFQGADARVFDDFAKDYAQRGVTVKHLNRTYRCGRNIVDVANHVLQHSLKETELMQGGNGQGQFLVQCGLERAGELIQESIEEVGAKHVAVLYRSKGSLPPLEEALVRANIPYALDSGGLFDLVEVKHVLHHLKTAVAGRVTTKEAWAEVVGCYQHLGLQTAARSLELNPAEPWNLSDVTMKLPKHRAPAWQALGQLMDDLVRLEGPAATSPARGGLALWESRFAKVVETLLPHWAAWRDVHQSAEAVSALEAWVKAFPPQATLSDVLGQAALIQQRKREDNEEETLQVLTVHKSKGLEWKHVFLFDVAEGRFPFISNGFMDIDEAEEMRLVYVGVTRGIEQVVAICRDDATFESVRWLEPYRKAVSALQDMVA